MADTTRLSLPRPTGSDLVSGGDDAITEISNTLDSAAIFAKGTLAARPSAAALDGKLYIATDTGAVYLSDGSAWLELATGAPVPIGGSIEYGGSTDPADTRFLLEDGRAISRATYSVAFGILGTAYGAGNGTTTFNIPDSRGRGSVAPDDMGTAAGAAGRMASNNTRGATSGSETKTLVSGNLPAHAHDQGTLVNDTTGSHDHTFGTLAVTGDGAHTHGIGSYAVAGSGTLTTGTESADHIHSGTTGAESAFHSHIYQYPNSIAVQRGIQDQNVAGPTNHAVGSGNESASHVHAFATGGRSAAHTHTVASHAHTLSGSSASATHTHGVSGSVASNGNHTHSISGSTGSVGSGTPYNNMGPYVVKNRIIRVL